MVAAAGPGRGGAPGGAEEPRLGLAAPLAGVRGAAGHEHAGARRRRRASGSSPSARRGERASQQGGVEHPGRDEPRRPRQPHRPARRGWSPRRRSRRAVPPGTSTRHTSGAPSPAQARTASAAAQAPVPQERVSPEPRSWTRMATSPMSGTSSPVTSKAEQRHDELDVGAVRRDGLDLGGPGEVGGGELAVRRRSATTVCGLPRSTERAGRATPSRPATWTSASDPASSAAWTTGEPPGPQVRGPLAVGLVAQPLHPGAGRDVEPASVARRRARAGTRCAAGTRRRPAPRCRTSRRGSRRCCGSP